MREEGRLCALAVGGWSVSNNWGLSTPALQLINGGWRVTDGGWTVTDSGWRRIGGGWRATAGCWGITGGGNR